MKDLFDGDIEYKECQPISTYPVPTAAWLDQKYGDFKFQAKGGGKGKGKGGPSPDTDHGGRGGLGTAGAAAKRARVEQPPQASQPQDEVMGGGTVGFKQHEDEDPAPVGLGMGSAGLGFQQAPASPTYAAPSESGGAAMAVAGVTKKTKAQLMMEKMGWQAGQGLGKTGEGRKEAVITNEKLDKTGVGFEYDDGAIQQRRHTVDVNKARAHPCFPSNARTVSLSLAPGSGSLPRRQVDHGWERGHCRGRWGGSPDGLGATRGLASGDGACHSGREHHNRLQCALFQRGGDCDPASV